MREWRTQIMTDENDYIDVNEWLDDVSLPD